MDKTIVVEITMRKLHPLYKKYVTKSKSIKAHDEKNEAHEGDTVGWSSAGRFPATSGGGWSRSSRRRNKAAGIEIWYK